MDIQRRAAFSHGATGGNPAGVLLDDRLPDPAQMQQIAADIGYSETVFAAPEGDAWRVRYFAPEAEVPFCGHATIALGAALGEAHGAGSYRLVLNDATISVRVTPDGRTTLTSPPVSHEAVPSTILNEALHLFALEPDALANEIAPAFGFAGIGKFLLLPLARQIDLRAMCYDQATGADFMRAHGLITVDLFWRETATLIHCRNAFAGHGVYEDPATGAAASALGGYLRDAAGLGARFKLFQGGDMGMPSHLEVAPLEGEGAPVEVSGETRIITAP